VVLHHLLDLPVAEVARELEVAPGTVKSWLHRGRVALAVQLADLPAAPEVSQP
jgi:RNA polymerase sigma-70 factor (ECF subfamily)